MTKQRSTVPGHRIPSLHALRCFEVAARHESISKAARELHLTHSAVSRQVSQLEKTLGIELFHRIGRKVEITSEGERLAAELNDCLLRISDVVDELSQRKAENNTVVLSCEPSFLMRWLIPRLPRLNNKMSGEQLHLVAAGGVPNFEQSRIDIAIRRRDFPIDEPMKLFAFYQERVGPVCRPSMAESIGEAGACESVVRLVTQTRPDAWATWEKLSGKAIGYSGEQVFEHFYLTLQAATAEIGVAIGPFALVVDDLSAGVLTAPMGFVLDGSEYVVMTPFKRLHDLAESIAGWLRGEIRGLETEHAHLLVG